MNALATRRRTVRGSAAPLRIAVTLEGRATAARVSRFTLQGDGRLAPMESTRYELTDKGRAAGSFLKSRANHYEAVNDSRFDDGTPDYNAPEVRTTFDAMDAAAAEYSQEHAGYICEDCQRLENCVCPNV